MRITNKMLYNNLLRNLNRNLNLMSKTQEQMSTGKRVSKPSDDPIDVTLIMGMKAIASEQETHIKNIEDAIGWLDATDQALDSLGEALKRAYELTLQGANGASSQDARDAIAKEIRQIIEEVKEIGNSNYAGRYIFGGTITTKPPFDKGTGQFQGNNQKLEWEIGSQVTLAINSTGEVFGITFDNDGKPLGESKIIKTLEDLANLLESNGSSGYDTYIGELNSHLDQVLNERAAVGAKSRRLDMAHKRATQVNLDFTELISKKEDIDIAEVTMYYAMQEAVYHAALMTGARILQPTLLHFLR